MVVQVEEPVHTVVEQRVLARAAKALPVGLVLVMIAPLAVVAVLVVLVRLEIPRHTLGVLAALVSRVISPAAQFGTQVVVEVSRT